MRAKFGVRESKKEKGDSLNIDGGSQPREALDAPRIARLVAVAVPHKVTQRGNNRQQVFFYDADRRLYLSLFAEHCEKHRLSVLGCCLMLDHAHLVVVPTRLNSMALALDEAHNLYSRMLNRARRRSGHLWQNRFFSAPLGRDYLRLALRYVDLNPVRAGLAAEATSYRWSSALAHQRMSDPYGLIDQRLWREICPRGDWAEVLRYGEMEAAWMSRLRSATKSGKPLGDKGFVEKLERRAGKDLTLRSRGRPSTAQLLAVSRGAGG